MMNLKPSPGEMLEAKSFPNGWVYRIDSKYDPSGKVPPKGIVGAWQVNECGEIVGEFKHNPNYCDDLEK